MENTTGFSRHLLSSVLITALAAPASPQTPAAKKPPAATTPAAAGDPRVWPREIAAGDLTFTVYQPQLEAWDGSRASYQAALAVQARGEQARTFGVAAITARTSVDKDERLVTFDDIKIESLRFPSAPEKAEAWRAAIQDKVAAATRAIDLDRFEAGLAALEAGEKVERLPVRNEPPRIVFSKVPAILIHVDGPTVYGPVKDTKLTRVVNTRPLVLRDAKGQHFVRVFDGWLAAPALEGPYGVAKKTPGDLKKALKAAQESGSADLLPGGDPKEPKKLPTLKQAPAPALVVATSPSELIVTKGEPSYVPIATTKLLYVENTTGHVFKHTGDQKTYVLVSGRWFRAATPEGPWEFVAGDALPEDFASIPDDSPKENVKASVAGTAQAQEALIANSIPQTAQVKRSEAKLTPPKFDGAPQLAKIEGTTLQYVVNTPTPIIMAGPGAYYAVENGIWFTAGSLAGPWAVATSVPAEIYAIPPSAPLHYVTYVKVYNATPDTVYVGYTPGYYGTCVSYGTVVYGTGYAYSPWVSTYWYGPPVTYGMGVAVAYTPWTGWAVGYGYGWAWGAATVGWGWGAYPWYGPVGWGAYYPYYPGYYGGAAVGPHGAAVWGPGGWAATTGNVYSRWGSHSAVTRTSAGYNAWTGNAWANQVGASYNSRTGVISAGQRAGVQNAYTGDYASGRRGVAAGPGGAVAAGRGATVGNAYTGNQVSAGQGAVYNPKTGETTRVGGVSGERGTVARVGDDIYAGRDGNVYRRGENGGWEQPSGGGWQGADAGRTSGLDRQYQARSQGSQRAQQFSSGGYRSAGARGGGRRR
jgi:hypothetical protein